MVNEIPISEADAYRSPQPMIRTIGWADLKDALVKGLADFKEMPTHVAFLCAIYPFVMLIMARALAGYDVLPLVFPFLAGYTLIGPLVATGMYELSRRREQGLDSRRRHALDVFRSPAFGSIVALGILLMAIYFAWLAAAQAIYGQYLGSEAPESIPAFIAQVISTPEGWSVIVVGNGVGFIFAVLVLALSVVSFPMLLDRHRTSAGKRDGADRRLYAPRWISAVRHSRPIPEVDFDRQLGGHPGHGTTARYARQP